MRFTTVRRFAAVRQHFVAHVCFLPPSTPCQTKPSCPERPSTPPPTQPLLSPPPRSRILYHGPVSDVVPHFRSLGLECPDRKDVPSFLLEITTPLGQRQFAGPELRQRFNLPPPDVDLVPARWGGAG